MTKAGGYIRTSTQGQVRDGYSLAYQRDEIIRHCAENGVCFCGGKWHGCWIFGKFYISFYRKIPTKINSPIAVGKGMDT